MSCFMTHTTHRSDRQSMLFGIAEMMMPMLCLIATMAGLRRGMGQLPGSYGIFDRLSRLMTLWMLDATPLFTTACRRFPFGALHITLADNLAFGGMLIAYLFKAICFAVLWVSKIRVNIRLTSVQTQRRGAIFST